CGGGGRGWGGGGGTSWMALMVRPAACRAVMADSRPEPGPLTRTSISFRPNLVARSAAVSAARWAANGVLLRLPLKPTVPAEAKQSVSPLVSVIVTIVLLKVALMWATPRLTLRRALRFLLLAMVPLTPNPSPTKGRGESGSLATHFLDALLPGDGLARALAGAGVGAGALAADRQVAAGPPARGGTEMFLGGGVVWGPAPPRGPPGGVVVRKGRERAGVPLRLAPCALLPGGTEIRG